jgi:drug/metabolite transporter (DMT)-like permease
MATKWRPGSAGEKEQKEARVIGVFVSLISLLCLALIFVIPTEYREAVKQTSKALNILGAILVAGSVIPIIKGLTSQDGVEGHIKWWAGSLALGLFLAACQGL